MIGFLTGPGLDHWVIAPLVITPLMGAVMILAMRNHLDLARIFSVATVSVLLLVALGLLWSSAGDTIVAYELGNWPAPFGIVLVLDRLSALMVTLTALLALAVVLYAIGSGWDARGRHFHALLQFQLLGIFGAFLTGDIFNLFVFFEVLLIASYGLMIHGGGARRLQAGVQYVVYNLLGSTLFLFALGTIYAVTGTLNMADLAERVATMPPESSSLIRVAAVLVLGVFAIKAALVPLHFWLPATYAEAPGVVAALFAIMTKVGAYAILRVHTLIFGPDVPVMAGLIGPGLLWLAMLTLVVGSLGILGARNLGRMAAFAAIASMGTVLIGIGLFTPQATAATLYYMIHSTLAGAALFLVVDLVRARRAGEDDRLIPQRPMPQNGLIAALFFASAIAMAGMPPLSGFLGKLLVMDAARADALVWVIWAVILITSLIAVVGFARAGSLMFWKRPETPQEAPLAGTGAGTVDGTVAKPVAKTRATPAAGPRQPALPLAATCGLLAAIVAMTIFAGPVSGFLSATATQLHDTEAYIGAVLTREGDAP